MGTLEALAIMSTIPAVELTFTAPLGLWAAAVGLMAAAAVGIWRAAAARPRPRPASLACATAR